MTGHDTGICKGSHLSMLNRISSFNPTPAVFCRVASYAVSAFSLSPEVHMQMLSTAVCHAASASDQGRQEG